MFQVSRRRRRQGAGALHQRQDSANARRPRDDAKGEGDDVFYDGGHVRRDVTVVVEEESHAELQRVGAEFSVLWPGVPLLDALTGFAIDVPTVQRDDKRGKAFVVRADAGDLPVAPDDVWILKGEGMRDASGRRGDLLIRFVVEFPKTLPDEDDRRGRLARCWAAARHNPCHRRSAASSAACSAAAPVARTRLRGGRAPSARVEDLYRAKKRRRYVRFCCLNICVCLFSV